MSLCHLSSSMANAMQYGPKLAYASARCKNVRKFFDKQKNCFLTEHLWIHVLHMCMPNGKAISFYLNTELYEKLEWNSSLKTTDSFVEPIWYPSHG